MRFRPRSARPLLPIPWSVLLTLLWVGLIRLLFLAVAVYAPVQRGGESWAAGLLGQRVLGRARLPTIIIAVSLLLLIYLWLDYRSRPGGWLRGLVFLAAAALLVYLGWAVWLAWWRGGAQLPLPEGVLLTALGGAGPG